RAVVVGGSAVKAAAAVLIARIIALAASRSSLDASALEWGRGHVHRRGDPAASVLSLAALAADDTPDAHAARTAVRRFAPAKLTYSYGAQIAHVAIDPETGATEVLRLVTLEDIGRAINPALVEGQAHGAAVQGLGGAFLEELVYDDAGQLLTGTLAEYALPPATAFPHIDAITLEESASTLNPLGAK